MKKLLLLVGTFCVLSSLQAMENRPVAALTVEDFGVDISDRQSVIEFYRKKKHAFENSFVKAKAAAPHLSRSEARNLFNNLIQKVKKVSAESERDLNRDTFARIFEAFVDELTTYRSSWYPEQEDPKMRSKNIRKYINKEKSLRDRFHDYLTTDLERNREQKIENVQTILEEARFLSCDSQRELHEVELAHKLSPFIRGLESELSQLQSGLEPERKLGSRKRDLE